ncbi:hypothetical protein AKJ16_DCAP01207 [Drosera capensis]
MLSTWRLLNGVSSPAFPHGAVLSFRTKNRAQSVDATLRFLWPWGFAFGPVRSPLSVLPYMGMDRMSNDVIYQVNWGTDSFSRSYGLRFVPGRSYSTEGTPRRKSMRSRVEHRIQNESSRGDKEIRRAKGVKLKLMPPDERFIYNLKRAICGEEVEGKRKSNNRTG